MINLSQPQSDTDLKTCCAALYETDWAKLLLGDSFHPGGLSLTKQVGVHLGLKPGMRLLDVAAGHGSSALFLAQEFGCQVVGIDYGRKAVAQANEKALAAGLAGLVTFEPGDAEHLHFSEASFDALLCECAFCTFPHKSQAAAEFNRVLKPNGRLGLSDLTRTGPLPQELETLLAWVACIADALSVEQYVDTFAAAGLTPLLVEPHNAALEKMVQDVQTKLMGVELMVKLNKLDFPIADIDEAKQLARSAGRAVKDGLLGYTVIIAKK